MTAGTMDVEFPRGTIGTCPRCGAAMAIRTNRATGEGFLGCTAYPEYRQTKPLLATGVFAAALKDAAEQRERYQGLLQEYALLQLRCMQLEARTRQQGRSTTRNSVSRSAITRLIALAHPDKWHTRPTTELAHEMTVALLKLRDQGEGRA
jgi:Topoisomerase DNA binding C4 zinc finger